MVDPSFLFDWKNGLPLQRLVIGQQLSSWLQHTQTRENGGSSSLRIISNEAAFYLEMARLARKTGNYRLAEKHIKIHYNKRLSTLDNFQLNILRVSLDLFLDNFFAVEYFRNLSFNTFQPAK